MVRADAQALNFQDPECPCALWRASGNGAGGDSQEISVDYFLREDRSRSKVSLPWASTGAFASLSLSAGWADNRRRSHHRSLDLTPPVSAGGNGQVRDSPSPQVLPMCCSRAHLVPLSLSLLFPYEITRPARPRAHSAPPQPCLS